MPYGKKNSMTRKEAYHWLSEQLNINAKKCHIAMFDDEMCDKVIQICKTNFRIRKKSKRIGKEGRKSMNQFEENLSWILQDFKDGQKNFGETVVAIEELIVRSLGLTSYHSEELKRAHKYIEELEEEKKERRWK